VKTKTTRDKRLIIDYSLSTFIYVIVNTKTSIKVFRSNRGRPDDTGG